MYVRIAVYLDSFSQLKYCTTDFDFSEAGTVNESSTTPLYVLHASWIRDHIFQWSEGGPWGDTVSSICKIILCLNLKRFFKDEIWNYTADRKRHKWAQKNIHEIFPSSRQHRKYHFDFVSETHTYLEWRESQGVGRGEARKHQALRWCSTFCKIQPSASWSYIFLLTITDTFSVQFPLCREVRGQGCPGYAHLHRDT